MFFWVSRGKGGMVREEKGEGRGEGDVGDEEEREEDDEDEEDEEDREKKT